MAAFFTELGQRIGRRWRAKDFSEEAFSDLACEALVETPPSGSVDFMDILRYLRDEEGLLPQVNVDSMFGQPPITVYSCDQFYIEALFWVDGTTTVHQHAFMGAFHVLHGSSLHAGYDFDVLHRFNRHLLVGKLKRRPIELLRKGDTRPIHAGRAGTHSLFHLDRPSVSIVVRAQAGLADPQYTYMVPGIAWNPFYKTGRLTRCLQSLQFLKDIDHPDLESFARDLIARSGSIESFFVVEKMIGHLESARFTAFLDSIRADHPTLVDQLRPAFAEARRERKIVGLRRKVHRPEHRFLLALLLNGSRQGDILRLVAEQYPERPATEQITTWLRELSELKIPGARQNAIGIDLNETALAIFKSTLECGSLERALEQLRNEYDADDVARQAPAIKAMSDAFRASPLFGPLFDTSAAT